MKKWFVSKKLDGKFCVDMCDQKLGYGIKNEKIGHKNVEKERE
jgi:hypothetical protein